MMTGLGTRDGFGFMAGLVLAPAAAAGTAIYCGTTQILPRPGRWWMSDAALADLEKRAAAGDMAAQSTLAQYRGARGSVATDRRFPASGTGTAGK